MKENDEYEYMLHTWGGFYNEEHKAIHKQKPGYFFFSSKTERQKAIDKLQRLEIALPEARMLCIKQHEGTDVRYETIAKMVFVHAGKEYEYEYNYGFNYPEEGAEFMFRHGNYSCDCNRSAFLAARYPDFHELDCGHNIEMLNFAVSRIKNLQETNHHA